MSQKTWSDSDIRALAETVPALIASENQSYRDMMAVRFRYYYRRFNARKSPS